MRKLVLLVAVLFLVGCIFDPQEVIAHPDAPLLLLEVKRGKARCAVYDPSTNSMVELAGWIRLDDDFKGWTLSKIDWQDFIRREAGTVSADTHPVGRSSQGRLDDVR